LVAAENGHEAVAKLLEEAAENLNK